MSGGGRCPAAGGDRAFSCDVPFDRGEIDHVVYFEHGGETTQDNGRCGCRHHHRRTLPSP